MMDSQDNYCGTNVQGRSKQEEKKNESIKQDLRRNLTKWTPTNTMTIELHWIELNWIEEEKSNFRLFFETKQNEI